MPLPVPKDRGTASMGAHLNDVPQLQAYATAIEQTIACLRARTRTVRVLHVGAPFGGALVFHSLAAGADRVDLLEASAAMAECVRAHFASDARVRVIQKVSTEYETDEPYHLTIMAWAGALHKMAHMYAHDLVVRQVSQPCFIPAEISYAVQIRASLTLCTETLAVYLPAGFSTSESAFVYAAEPPPEHLTANKRRQLRFKSALSHRGIYEVGLARSAPCEYAFVRLGAAPDQHVLEFPGRIDLRTSHARGNELRMDHMLVDFYTMVLNPLDTTIISVTNSPDDVPDDPSCALARRLVHPNLICPLVHVSGTACVRVQVQARSAGDVALWLLSAETSDHDLPDPSVQPFPHDKMVSLLERTAMKVIDARARKRARTRASDDDDSRARQRARARPRAADDDGQRSDDPGP